MLKVIALIILWSLPWNPDYRVSLLSLDVSVACGEGFVEGAYDRRTNTILLCPDAIGSLAELRRVMLHESQHHMQWTQGVASYDGGWEGFEQAVLAEMEAGDYTEHQQASVQALAGMDAAELCYSNLHAELPTVLGLDMPASLCGWYPWFKNCR